MIQDIVDCIQWIYDNIHDFGGDKVTNIYIYIYTHNVKFYSWTNVDLCNG